MTEYGDWQQMNHFLNWQVVVNVYGAQRYPSLAGRVGVIRDVIPYEDGTIEYVVDFGSPGDWDWFRADEVDAIEANRSGEQATHADRVRRSMGQMPPRLFDLEYLQACYRSVCRIIETESHNAKHRPSWRAPLRVSLAEKVQSEIEIQTAEQLQSEIELAYAWGYFPFQEIDH